MRTQHQIASELHGNLGHEDERQCPWSDVTNCDVFMDIVAALREQSRLTRAQIVVELQERAARWPINKSVVLGSAEAIRAERGAQTGPKFEP